MCFIKKLKIMHELKWNKFYYEKEENKHFSKQNDNTVQIYN